MNIFVTGATGFIGSAVSAELIRSGHRVFGLARNEASAAKLKAAGITPHAGDVQNHESLRSGAVRCDGVLHLGFIHDFSRFHEMCEVDRQAICALGEALIGTDKPLLIASGTALAEDNPVTEDSRASAASPHPRVMTERAGDELAAKGIRAGFLRFPPTVHGPGDHGFITILGELAKQKGLAAYVEDGANHWAAVNRLDAGLAGARAITSDFAPGTRFQVVAEEAVPFRQIAEAIGKKLGLPAGSIPKEQAAEHFTWLAHFASMNGAASSAKTRALLRWAPSHLALLPDIAASYF